MKKKRTSKKRAVTKIRKKKVVDVSDIIAQIPLVQAPLTQAVVAETISPQAPATLESLAKIVREMRWSLPYYDLKLKPLQQSPALSMSYGFTCGAMPANAPSLLPDLVLTSAKRAEQIVDKLLDEKRESDRQKRIDEARKILRDEGELSQYDDEY